jgi:hypothetical protein
LECEYNFDENLGSCEDYDWACEMLHRGYNVVCLPGFGVFHSHYHMPNYKSWDERKEDWGKWFKIIDKKNKIIRLYAF